MDNDTAPRKTNTTGQGTSDRAWVLAEQHNQRAARRRQTSRRRRQRGPDEPSLPFWDFVYPER